MAEKLQTLLGVQVPVQFEPVITVTAALMLLFLLAYFAEMLKLLVLRR